MSWCPEFPRPWTSLPPIHILRKPTFCVTYVVKLSENISDNFRCHDYYTWTNMDDHGTWSINHLEEMGSFDVSIFSGFWKIGLYLFGIPRFSSFLERCLNSGPGCWWSEVRKGGFAVVRQRSWKPSENCRHVSSCNKIAENHRHVSGCNKIAETLPHADFGGGSKTRVLCSWEKTLEPTAVSREDPHCKLRWCEFSL